MSSIIFTVTKITISINIFICFRYYTVRNQFFGIKIHVKVFYIQIWFKCKTLPLFFLIKTMEKTHYRKIVFVCRFCKNYWITCCTHMTSHAIWVDEIEGVMISIKNYLLKIKFTLFFISCHYMYLYQYRILARAFL